MVIMMQVDYDRTFDTSDPNHDRIFRVEFMYQENVQVVINRPLAEAFFASSPHIVASALALLTEAPVIDSKAPLASTAVCQVSEAGEKAEEVKAKGEKVYAVDRKSVV